VVTQDCDLEQDFAARFPEVGKEISPDKLLFRILLCGVYDENLLKAGQHRPKAEDLQSARMEGSPEEQDPRYHSTSASFLESKFASRGLQELLHVPCDFVYSELAETAFSAPSR